MTTQRPFIEKLCSHLKKIKALPADQADSFIQEFKGKSRIEVENFFISEAIVSRRDLLEALSAVYKIPAFDTRGYFFEHTLLLAFDKDFLLRNYIIPLSIEDDEIVTMIAGTPDNEPLRAAINEYVSWDVTFMVGIHQDIEDAVQEYYDSPVTEDGLVEELSLQELREQRLHDDGARIITPNDFE